MNAEELERYGRQILVRDFGGSGQTKLRAAHIGVVGAGGVGAPILLYLAGAGIGAITLYEDDEISLSNLHRQILYQSGDVGASKAEKVQEALMRLNPYVNIHLAGRFDGQDGPHLDLLIDGSDQLQTRQLVNRKAAQWATPLLAASLAQWEGQIGMFDPARFAGCYECLYPQGTDASAIPSCSEAGVIGPVAGVIGTMAALEALKFLAGIEALEAGMVYIYDGLYREGRVMKISPRSDCPVCGEKSR